MPKPKKGDDDMVMVTFNIPREMRTRLKVQAALDGKTMSSIFIKWVEDYLKKAKAGKDE